MLAEARTPALYTIQLTIWMHLRLQHHLISPAPAFPFATQNGKRMAGEEALRTYLDKWDRKYWATYKVGNRGLGEGFQAVSVGCCRDIGCLGRVVSVLRQGVGLLSIGHPAPGLCKVARLPSASVQ
jgi:hypothetical protein